MSASQQAPFVATCCIAADHPCLPGHFPGRPIVPGVVVLDHVVAALEAANRVGPGGLGPLCWPQVKFQQPLLPGQQAQIELTCIESSPRWRFRVRCGEQAIATGEVRQA